ncbi:N-acetyltransferase [Desulfovibrio sp. OttesenSCG-928-G15]|nr:N-acetyltransferase [Desulfovibrio sp. OttesenSCG-928-G15]
MASCLIRPERAEEFARIYELVKEAFATARVSDGTEQDFVNQLRAGNGYIPELALVAEEPGGLAGEEAGALVGHVILTRLPYEPHPGDAEWKNCLVADAAYLLLAPLCVREDRRGQGLGAQLVREVLAKAHALGYSAVFLVGDAGYYGRLGFAPVSDFRIQYAPAELPAEHVLVYELVSGALVGRLGTVRIL